MENTNSGCAAAQIEDVRLRWGLRIPLRDGAHLSAIAYLPRQQERAAPVIFVMTPYVAQTYHEYGVYFAARGYGFVSVDVRGRGDSDGLFKANGNEARDGYDVVEWIARQPYCDGRVAMWGNSYMGYAQWATAKELPPHLATIVPAAAPYRGVDSPMRNNIFGSYRIQWLTLLGGRTSQEKIFADQPFWSRQYRTWFQSGVAFRRIDALLGNPSPVFQEWLGHPHQDAYWDSYNPTAQEYARIRLPILTITGVYDGNQPGALHHYREHMKNADAQTRSQHYLVIGPWDHAGTRAPRQEFGGLKIGPTGMLDLSRLHLEWYGWRLQGGPKPKFLRKNVAYYVMGADEWRYADSLEDVTARSVPFYLKPAGSPAALGNGPPVASDPDRYIYDPRDTSLAELESSLDPASLVDQRMFHARRNLQLVYDTAPFDEDAEISGFFKLSVWLAIDQPDTDFAVSVHAVEEDRTVQLATDCLRARYRESLREPRLVTSKEPLRYDFERFTFVARKIKRGSRLRLVIGPIHSIYWEKNYNAGGAVADETIADARPVVVRLFHDAEHPSALYVPFGQPEN